MQGRLSFPEDRQIQHYPLNNEESEFYHAKFIGLDCIEWIFEEKNYKKNKLFDDKYILRLTKKYNIKVNSLIYDYFMTSKLFNENKMKINFNYNLLKKVIIACKKNNIKIIEIPLIENASLNNLKAKNKKNFYFIFNNIIKFAKKHGIKISIESDLTPLNFLNFLNSFAYKIYANYDSGNTTGMNRSHTQEIKILKDHIINVHIKDKKIKGKTVPLGNGDTNFSKIFKLLKKINYKGDIILQGARQDISHKNNLHNIFTIKNYLKFVKKYI